MARYCRNCGAEVSEKAAFCKKCGTPVRRRQEPAASAPAAAPTPASARTTTAAPATPSASANASAYSRAQTEQRLRGRRAGRTGAGSLPIRKASVPAVVLSIAGCVLMVAAIVIWVMSAVGSGEQVVRTLESLDDEAAWFGGLAYVAMAGIPSLVALLTALSFASASLRTAKGGEIAKRSIAGTAVTAVLCLVALVCILVGPRIPAFADGSGATVLAAVGQAYLPTAIIALALAIAATVAAVFGRRLSRA